MKTLLTFFLILASTFASAGQHLVFMIGEREYKTGESLRSFYESELKPAGFTAEFLVAEAEDDVRNQYPGIANALEKADLLVVSVRRRAPEAEGMTALKKFANSGKPIVSIRTSSHAFHLRGKPAPEGHALWEEFDPVVLGGNYNGHYKDERAQITVTAGAEKHPILAGVGSIPAVDKLYRSGPLKEGTTNLLTATIEGKPSEPVAWTHQFGPNKARIFHTSLGQVEDFTSADFRKLMVNGIQWALGQ